MSFLTAFLAGAVTGILSAFGIGGGTLLMLWMTVFASIDLPQARCINLMYFLPLSAAALYSHIKNGFVDKNIAIPAIAAGTLTAAAASFIATAANSSVLRLLFGIFLLFVGISEFISRR